MIAECQFSVKFSAVSDQQIAKRAQKFLIKYENSDNISSGGARPQTQLAVHSKVSFICS